MVIGITLIIIAVLVALIWIVIEIKRLKHKIFAIFLIGLILFMYVTLSFTLKGKDIDYATIPGLMKASKIYFSWLGSVAGNMQTMTSNAVKMDWDGNETVS